MGEQKLCRKELIKRRTRGNIVILIAAIFVMIILFLEHN